MLYFNRLNILWVICLAVLFFTSYGSVNHIAAYMKKLLVIGLLSLVGIANASTLTQEEKTQVLNKIAQLEHGDGVMFKTILNL